MKLLLALLAASLPNPTFTGCPIERNDFQTVPLVVYACGQVNVCAAAGATYSADQVLAAAPCVQDRIFANRFEVTK